MKEYNRFTNVNLFLTKCKTPVLYTGGSVIKSLAQLFSVLIIARYISPDDLGLWHTIYLFVTYAGFLQAGVINGLNLELPYAYGKREEDKAKMMAGTAQTYTILTSVFVLLMGLLYLIFGDVANVKVKYGILAILLIINLSFYQSYLTSTFRSKNSFKKLAAIQIVEAVVILASLVLVIYYSFYGMIVRAGLILVIVVTLLHITRPIKIGFIWERQAFIKLLIVGFPIFGLAYMQSVSATADKLWVLKYSNITEVGLYSFALYGFSAFSIISSSVATYVYPRMTYNYGKNGDRLVLWKYVKRLTLMLFILLTPLSILAFYVIPPMVSNYFPNYILSISAMQILAFAGVFTGCVVGVNVLWSIRCWRYMILYMSIYSLLLITLPFLGIKMLDNRLTGAAYGILAASILNLISGYTLSYLGTHNIFPKLKRALN